MFSSHRKMQVHWGLQAVFFFCILLHSNFPLSFRCCGIWPTQGQETWLTTGAVHPTLGPETQKQTTSFPPPLQQLTAWKQTWENTH